MLARAVTKKRVILGWQGCWLILFMDLRRQSVCSSNLFAQLIDSQPPLLRRCGLCGNVSQRILPTRIWRGFGVTSASNDAGIRVFRKKWTAFFGPWCSNDAPTSLAVKIYVFLLPFFPQEMVNGGRLSRLAYPSCSHQLFWCLLHVRLGWGLMQQLDFQIKPPWCQLA